MLGLLVALILADAPVDEYRCADTTRALDTKFFYGDDCEACDDARIFLYRQGIPFQSLNVKDGDNWQRMLHSPGRGRLPAIQICGQWFFGFSDETPQRIFDVFLRIV